MICFVISCIIAHRFRKQIERVENCNYSTLNWLHWFYHWFNEGDFILGQVIFRIELAVNVDYWLRPINIALRGKILTGDKSKTLFSYVYRGYTLPKQISHKFSQQIRSIIYSFFFRWEDCCINICFSVYFPRKENFRIGNYTISLSGFNAHFTITWYKTTNNDFICINIV